MQKAVSNACKYKPSHGAFQAVATKLGVTRQYVRQAYKKDQPEIVEAVMDYEIKQLEEKQRAMQRINAKINRVLRSSKLAELEQEIESDKHTIENVTQSI